MTRIEDIERHAAEGSVETWRKRLAELPDNAQLCYTDGDNIIALNTVELREHPKSGLVYALVFYRSPEKQDDVPESDRQ